MRRRIPPPCLLQTPPLLPLRRDSPMRREGEGEVIVQPLLPPSSYLHTSHSHRPASYCSRCCPQPVFTIHRRSVPPNLRMQRRDSHCHGGLPLRSGLVKRPSPVSPKTKLSLLIIYQLVYYNRVPLGSS